MEFLGTDRRGSDPEDCEDALWSEEEGADALDTARDPHDDEGHFWQDVQDSADAPTPFLPNHNPPNPSNHPPKEADPLARIGLDANKAGMAGVDKERINSIILETSKNSRFYNNEMRKDEAASRKINTAVREYHRLLSLDLTRERSLVDARVRELEQHRILDRVIVHVDMDAFYASVEERDAPHLKDKPMAVGGISMLTTANYAARKFGVRAAMPGYLALKLCPELVLVKPDHAKYARVAGEVRKVLARYDPEFRPMSLDEAYLDFTEYLASHPDLTPETAVAQMRAEICAETGLTASAGIAANTLLAKVCSDRNKPNGQYLLPSDKSSILDFLRSLPIRKPPGIGKVTEKFLSALGIATVGDMWEKRAFLYKLCSPSSFDFFLRVSLGIAQVHGEHPSFGSGPDRKSISHETTFFRMYDPAEMRSKLGELAHALAQEMQEEHIKGRTITVKLKRVDFRVFQRSKSLERFAKSEEELASVAVELLNDELAANPGMSLRLMGLRVSSLASTEVHPDGIVKYFKTNNASDPADITSGPPNPSTAPPDPRSADTSVEPPHAHVHGQSQASPRPPAITSFPCPICHRTIQSGADMVRLNLHVDDCLRGGGNAGVAGGSRTPVPGGKRKREEVAEKGEKKGGGGVGLEAFGFRRR